MIAVIGTAGRGRPMTREHWTFMCASARNMLPRGCELVSGGAAWSDHVAVALYLEGFASALHLALPAPVDMQSFAGPPKSAGSAANYYHRLFSQTMGFPSIQHIAVAIRRGATYTEEPAGPGMRAFFARNEKVAQLAFGCLAFTFGTDQPEDGGTKHTWDLICGPRMHVSLVHPTVN